jgi:hypothetical protein
MKRGTLLLVLFACATLAQVRQTQAIHRRYPPRYSRGTYAEYVIRKQKNGEPTVRQVYSGYSSNFPPPAFLYYGYPHSGDGTGIGPLDRR